MQARANANAGMRGTRGIALAPGTAFDRERS
jgi:hypothetical protein